MFAQKWQGTLAGMSDGASGLNTGSAALTGGISSWGELSGFSDDLTMGAIDWQRIIDQAFATGSQAINAYSGRTGGVQVGYNPQQGGIFAIQQTSPVYDEAAIYARGGVAPYGVNPYTQGPQGGAAEDALGSVANFVSQHPIWVFGGLAALYLLYRQPPHRR